MIWLAALMSFITACLLVYWGLEARFSKEAALRTRMASLVQTAGMGPRGANLREHHLEDSFVQRVILPAMALLVRGGERITPSAQLERFKAQLLQAGLYGDRWLRGILAVRGGGLVLGALGAVAAFHIKPGFAIMVGGATVLVTQILPHHWLRSQIARRRFEITRSLPDMLDLITASVEAGLSFDASVLRITARPGKSSQELKGELARYMADMRLGRSRSDALWDLARRCDVADLRSVVAALLQADELGVGVSNVLRAQGQGLRTRRRQRAQEAALQAPVKMLFPLVLFIFPALFIVTLGPAVLKILDTFAHMAH